MLQATDERLDLACAGLRLGVIEGNLAVQCTRRPAEPLDDALPVADERRGIDPDPIHRDDPRWERARKAYA